MVILAHDESIPALAYLPDGRRIVTGSYDGTVKVWNMDNGEQELEGAAMGHKSNISSLVVTRDGTKIVSGDDNGNIKVWNVESHVLVREWTQGRGYPIAISPDERLVAAGGASAIYTMEGRVVKNGIKLNEMVWSVAFSPDGKKLACGNWEGNIYVYNVDNGTPILGPLEGHQSTTCYMLWSRDGRRIFSASWDNVIRCWNSDTGEQIGQPWTGHTHWIRALSLSPDGSILSSVSLDKTVRFWDVTSGHPIGQHLQHDHPLFAIGFSPSGEFVASAGRDGNLCVWPTPRLNSVDNLVTTSYMCFGTGIYRVIGKSDGSQRKLLYFCTPLPLIVRLA